ncbi:hypothetical protein GQ53DRAFT_753672 [Thozetella sp. PMI_491]|nr:hypothetical protein GQ53DRAFT_753672 [Thozetella sp. PMI_491]
MAQRVCCGPGWDSTHRVKEHVYRKHRRPHRCQRCWETFENADALLHHHRSPQPCQLQDHTPVDGIDENQEKKLRSRKRETNESDRDTKDPVEVGKWRAMYNVIFPDVPLEDIPSPFYDYDKVYDSKNAAGKDRAQYLAEYKRYLVPRLRERLSEQFDKDLQIFEVEMKKKAIDLIMNVQLEILREFRDTCDRPISHIQQDAKHETASAGETQNRVSISPGVDSVNIQDLQFTLNDMTEFDFLGLSTIPEEQDFTWSGDLGSSIWGIHPNEQAKQAFDSGYASSSPSQQRHGSSSVMALSDEPQTNIFFGSGSQIDDAPDFTET